MRMKRARRCWRSSTDLRRVSTSTARVMMWPKVPRPSFCSRSSAKRKARATSWQRPRASSSDMAAASFAFAMRGMWNLAALQLGDVGVVIGRSAQLIVTTAEELQQIFQELSRSGSLDVVLQLHVADAAAQQDEQVFVVEELKLGARVLQKSIAVGMKGVRLQTAGEQLLGSLGTLQLRIKRRLLVEIRVQDGRHAMNQLGGGVARVGDGEDFVGTRGFSLDEVGDAARQHRGLAGSGAGDNQHGAVDVLDGLALLGGRSKNGALHGVTYITNKRRRI